MFGRNKIQLDPVLYERAARQAAQLGYATVEEFVAHVLEQHLQKQDEQTMKDKVLEKMKGLGYLQ